jgi:hypothetical protein
MFPEIKAASKGRRLQSTEDFWARNRLTESALGAGALSWWRIKSLGPSFGLFYTQLQYFHVISLVDCTALWNEFKVNNTLDIEESDEHCLHL